MIIRILNILKPKEGMSFTEFQERLYRHTELAKTNLKLMERYELTPSSSKPGEPPKCYAAELYYPDFKSFSADFSTEEGKKVVEDGQSFAEVTTYRLDEANKVLIHRVIQQ